MEDLNKRIGATYNAHAAGRHNVAAGAGAERVVACEMVRHVAEVVTSSVARNGFADRITMVIKKSSELVVGVGLPRPADIRVSEMFDARLLGDNVPAALSHAHERLVRPEATIVPALATVHMMPIEPPAIHEFYRLRNINDCGFDFEDFNLFANIGYDQLAPRRYAYEARSETVAVLDFDGATFFDTGPYNAATCWAQAVQVEGQPQPLLRVQAIEAGAPRRVRKSPSPLLRGRVAASESLADDQG